VTHQSPSAPSPGSSSPGLESMMPTASSAPPASLRPPEASSPAAAMTRPPTCAFCGGQATYLRYETLAELHQFRRASRTARRARLAAAVKRAGALQR
jgi:hypothetical protein